jgi:Uncharacterized protein conserved in bacteria
MSDPATINPRIVEALYMEALSLSDEVRSAFTLSGRLERARSEEDFARIALSSEGLRTTTRMMHAIAWLLNHRAYFMGELNELQLRHHGRLAPEMRASDPEHLVSLEPQIRTLVEATRTFYDRLLRLDQTWRAESAGQASGLQRLRERLEQRLAS